MNKQISWEIYLLNVKNPRASGELCPPGPLPGLCSGPTGGLKRPPDPSPNNFAPPPISNSYGPGNCPLTE